MNPKHIETYLEGLHKTIDSKLFFLNVLPKDFFNNKIIVDLGCGDGIVLKAIQKLLTPQSHTRLVAIDSNPLILNYAKDNLGFDYVTYFNTLEEFEQVLGLMNSGYELVLICESLLHEVGDFQDTIYKFVKEHCNYFIVRDMCVQTKDWDDWDIKKRRIYSNIIKYSNTRLLSDFALRYDLNIVGLLHYLLKYTYVENWATEVEEDYSSVHWSDIDLISMFSKKVIYDNKYIQEWRANRVASDFNIELKDFALSTHREIIIQVK